MNCGRLILPLVGLALLLAGCGRKSTTVIQPVEPVDNAPVQSFVGGPAAPAQSSIRRGMEIQKAKTYLYDIKQYYFGYKAERNRVPPNLKDFTDYMGPQASTLVKLLQEQAFTMVFKQNLPPEALVAYVSWEDGSGNRAVLQENGEIKVLNRQEFDAAVKR